MAAFGVSVVLPMNGASYVDVACLDITDFSSCGRENQLNGCNTSIGALTDFAGNGNQLVQQFHQRHADGCSYPWHGARRG